MFIMKNGRFLHERQSDLEGYEALARARNPDGMEIGDDAMDMFADEDDGVVAKSEQNTSVSSAHTSSQLAEENGSHDSGSSWAGQSDYIYDEASGYIPTPNHKRVLGCILVASVFYYYSSSLGYYYDPTTGLFCSASSGQWCCPLINYDGDNILACVGFGFVLLFVTVTVVVFFSSLWVGVVGGYKYNEATGVYDEVHAETEAPSTNS
ncbi:Angiogenic factor with G patch and FHA domains 1 [Bienertia sinuspersici]